MVLMHQRSKWANKLAFLKFNLTPKQRVYKSGIKLFILIIPIDLIRIGLTKKSPISKYFFDLWVDAPQYLSFGTLMEPILSNSFLNFID